jgi:hypothetical protein
VVREHQRHTRSTTERLVRTGRACVVLATRAVKGTAARRAGTTASRRHRRGPRPNPRAHGEGEVKVSSDYEPIELKKQRRGLPPKHALLRWLDDRRRPNAQLAAMACPTEAWRGETHSWLPQPTTGASNRKENAVLLQFEKGSGGATDPRACGEDGQRGDKG